MYSRMHTPQYSRALLGRIMEWDEPVKKFHCREYLGGKVIIVLKEARIS